MVVLRLLGWLLLLTSLIVLGRDVLAWLDTGTFTPEGLDQFWGNLDRASLDGVEAAIQRNVAPWIWSGIVVDFLTLWAAPVFAVAGIAALLLGRRQDHASSRRRRP